MGAEGLPIAVGVPVAGVYGAAATLVASSRVVGDNFDHFTIGADGKLSWGTGAAAPDTTLARSAVGELTVTSLLRVTNEVYIAGRMIARIGQADQVAVGAVGPGAESGLQLQSGEAGATLYRSAAGQLRIDGGLTVGNATGKPFNLLNGAGAGGTNVGGAIYFGTGAPNNANGANNDVYIRGDGAALTTIYQKRVGAWVGIV